MLKRRDSWNFLLHQLSPNFLQEKHLLVTPLLSLKPLYTQRWILLPREKFIPYLVSTPLPSHLFLARPQRIFKARSGLDTPANQFQFPLGDQEKALPYVYFGNVAATTSLYQLWRLCPDTLCIWLAAMYCSRLCYQNWGQARKFNPISLPSPKIPTVANCWLHWHLLLVRQEIERDLNS